jgi:TIGR00730 family protein
MYFCTKFKKLQMRNICVYCASSTQIKESYFDAAERLGSIFAKNNIKLIYGAGNMGLMGKVADSALSNGGKVTGVIPQFMCNENWHHQGLTELIVVETMHERKDKMAELADAVVALPGGTGTLEELLEIITWKQLGIFDKPIIILNTDGYYNPLLDLLENAIKGNFMREIHRNIWQVVNTPEEVLPAIENTPAWDKNIRKFAKI